MKNAHGRTYKKTKVYIYLYISLYENLFENGCIYIYIYILYRHECFTGKYTTRKIHKNYIRDPSGEFIDDVISVISLYYFINVFLSI